MVKRLIGRFKKQLLALFLVVEVFCCISVFISPKYFWPLGLINYGIPVLITLHIIIIAWLVFKRSRWFWAYLVVLAAAYYFIDITFNLPFKGAPGPNVSYIDVMSFNAKLFRHRKNYGKFSQECIDWSVSEPSAIKCFQEYSTNPGVDSIDVTGKLEARGYDHFAVAYPIPETNHNHGLAIFSKFPIINTGEIDLNGVSINNCIYVDVICKGDTLRVYNYHLNSMGLKLRMYKDPKDFEAKTEYLLKKLGRSSAKRAMEINLMLQSFRNCPYPYIVVGDFNELPYGNNYLRMRRQVNNTFEAEGEGFGFTFNHILFFLRIDHQFYSERVKPLEFSVLRSVKYSDHFPVKGKYVLE